MKAVILAAGEGRRLRPLTNRRPKPMLPVANKPILEHVLEAVVGAGIDEVVFVVGYQRSRIQTHFGDGDDWGIDIEYAVQEDQLGTGHAVLQARELVDGEFLVLNGDRIIETGLVESVRESDGPPTVVSVTRVASPHEYGVAVTEGERLRRIDEHPAGDPRSGVINAGVYRVTEEIFDAIAEGDRTPDGEIGLSNAVTRLANRDQVGLVRYRGRWLDVTYPWDLLSVNDEIASDTDDRIDGRLHEAAAVADRVHVADGTTVGPNTTIKRGTSLGANVTVEGNAVVSNAVVMQDATVADGAVVRDCVIDENVTIGPNATVVGGNATVVLEKTVHEGVTMGGVVGANATLAGGVVVSPGSIVGDGVTVASGVVVDGRIESNATVHGG